jgi:hypothetical protein
MMQYCDVFTRPSPPLSRINSAEPNALIEYRARQLDGVVATIGGSAINLSGVAFCAFVFYASDKNPQPGDGYAKGIVVFFTVLMDAGGTFLIARGVRTTLAARAAQAAMGLVLHQNWGPAVRLFCDSRFIRPLFFPPIADMRVDLDNQGTAAEAVQVHRRNQKCFTGGSGCILFLWTASAVNAIFWMTRVHTPLQIAAFSVILAINLCAISIQTARARHVYKATRDALLAIQLYQNNARFAGWLNQTSEQRSLNVSDIQTAYGRYLLLRPNAS